MKGAGNIEDNPVIKGLLDTVRSLQDQLSAQSDLQKIIQQKDRQIERLQAQVALLQRLLYGSKSEKRRLSEMPEGQLSLFANDSVVAELIPTEVSPSPKQDSEESKPAKKKPVRVALPDNLPKEVITLKPDGDLTCIIHKHEISGDCYKYPGSRRTSGCQKVYPIGQMKNPE